MNIKLITLIGFSVVAFALGAVAGMLQGWKAGLAECRTAYVEVKTK